MNFGTIQVADIFVGALNATEAYFGAEKVWEKSEPPTPPTGNWLCFTAEEANSTVGMAANGSAPSVSLEYSTDGSTWSPFVVGTTTVTLANIGDKVYVRATSTGNTGMASGQFNYNKFVMTGKISASGNVDTLLDQSGNPTLTSYCYVYLFSGCSSLTSAPELPATTLATLCYYGMFSSCTQLTTAPALPATTLANYCYGNMFERCSSLTTAPVLSATSLTERCYSHMFERCSSLTTAPALPATTLDFACYGDMFHGCSSLTTAPELPATRLTEWCYGSMFNGCSSLTAAPALPATTLTNACYTNMFMNCSNLNTITLGYTGNFSTTYFNNWVDGVAASGTFYYNGSDTTRGTSAIPTGWTVISEYGGLTITAREANSTVSMIKDSEAPSVTLEYSTDGTTWNPFVVGTTTVTLNNIGDKVYFRAGPNGNTTFTTQWTIDANRFVMTGSVDLSGNLNSIISQNYDNVTTINANGYGGIGYLFDNCTAIVDASKLLMKATTIGDFTYNRTFYRCSNMTKAPTIFATSIGSRYSFGDLFNGCSSLSEIKIYYTGNFGGEKTSNWVSGVPATGTFYYNGSDTTTGTSAIPSGWTVTPFTP